MQIDGYSDLTKLATGGMATVYKACQISLNRTVAIKLLLAEFLWDDEAKTLFDQESLVIAQLNHPNIIHIIDRGLSAKGRPFFVMDYIQGKELGQIIDNKKLDVNAKLNLLIQVCKGMAAAHNNGIIHRDIKPSNILIDANEHVYILDFGIAWLAANGKPENIVGTPDYMSPEQFSSPELVTQQSDFYSLGIIMYEMFTGSLPPGHRENLDGELQSLPTELSSLILKCLESTPNKRPTSADDIHLQLLSIIKGAHLSDTQKLEATTAFKNTDEKFLLLDVIKRDKYGSVFLFENKQNKKLLVLKKRKNSFAGYQEAKLLHDIKHPNIVDIYGISKSTNAFTIAMQHLSGGSLKDRLARPYSLSQFSPIANGICSALKFSHDNEIAHGNLRPSNILFDDNNNIKLTDFGLAEHYTNNANHIDWYQPKDQGCTSKTRDIYSSGAIFYHMLTGELVHLKNKRIQGNTIFETLETGVQDLLRNLIEEDRPDHYHSFDQVIPDLEKLNLHLSIKRSKNRKEKQKHTNKSLGILSQALLITSVISAISLVSLLIYLSLNK